MNVYWNGCWLSWNVCGFFSSGDNSGWADIFDRTITKKAEPQDLTDACCMFMSLSLSLSLRSDKSPDVL